MSKDGDQKQIDLLNIKIDRGIKMGVKFKSLMIYEGVLVLSIVLLWYFFHSLSEWLYLIIVCSFVFPWMILWFWKLEKIIEKKLQKG